MRGIAISVGLCAVLLTGPAFAQTAQTYVYDVHGRVTGATQAQPSGAAFTGYVYDAADGRTNKLGYPLAAPASTSELAPNEQLVLQQQLVSPDNRMRFAVQSDGNLVVWFGSTVLWATNTFGSQALNLAMQGDGNLVLYGPNSSVIWNTGTGVAGSRLVMQNDGNLVIYSGGTPVWSTGTGGH